MNKKKTCIQYGLASGIIVSHMRIQKLIAYAVAANVDPFYLSVSHTAVSVIQTKWFLIYKCMYMCVYRSQSSVPQTCV